MKHSYLPPTALALSPDLRRPQRLIRQKLMNVVRRTQCETLRCLSSFMDYERQNLYCNALWLNRSENVCCTIHTPSTLRGCSWQVTALWRSSWRAPSARAAVTEFQGSPLVQPHLIIWSNTYPAIPYCERIPSLFWSWDILPDSIIVSQQHLQGYDWIILSPLELFSLF